MEEYENMTAEPEPGNDEQLDPEQTEAPVRDDDAHRKAEEEIIERETPADDEEQGRREAAREQHERPFEDPADSPPVQAPDTAPPAE